MEFEYIIITKRTTGSEDGINIKLFEPDEEPQRVERSLACVFIATGCAKYPEAKKKAEPVAEHVEPKIVKPAVGPKEFK